jgi:hypothetical protein
MFAYLPLGFFRLPSVPAAMVPLPYGGSFEKSVLTMAARARLL